MSYHSFFRKGSTALHAPKRKSVATPNAITARTPASAGDSMQITANYSCFTAHFFFPPRFPPLVASLFLPTAMLAGSRVQVPGKHEKGMFHGLQQAFGAAHGEEKGEDNTHK